MTQNPEKSGIRTCISLGNSKDTVEDYKFKKREKKTEKSDTHNGDVRSLKTKESNSTDRVEQRHVALLGQSDSVQENALKFQQGRLVAELDLKVGSFRRFGGQGKVIGGPLGREALPVHLEVAVVDNVVHGQFTGLGAVLVGEQGKEL